MNNTEINEIISCLPNTIIYPYFKDKYALDLLAACFRNDAKIDEIKSSNFKRLIKKKVVKEVFKNCGNGKLNKELLETNWNESIQYLKLSFDSWGETKKGKSRWCTNQVSRPEQNLVLQVNFGSEHDILFYNKIGKKGKPYLEEYSHPINFKMNTLGWIRMDMDLNNNEVLIEEVQSDWVRNFNYLLERIKCKDSCCIAYKKAWNAKAVNEYHNFLKPYLKNYGEILLAAAIHFVNKELGLNNIWYHTNESGKHYKMGHFSLPPRSMYKQLPEKFCFDLKNDKPELIKNCPELKRLNRTGKDLNFYHLELKK